MGGDGEELIFFAVPDLFFAVWRGDFFAGVFAISGCFVVVICGEFVVDCVVNVVSGMSLFRG